MNAITAIAIALRPHRRGSLALCCCLALAIGFPATALAGQPPQFVTTPGAQTFAEDGTSGDLAVVVSDPDLQNLVLTATSGNTTLVPNANIVVTPVSGGPGTYARTVRVTPAPNRNVRRDNASQPVLITLQVSDASGGSVTETFTVNVTEINDPPHAADDLLAAMAEDDGARTIAASSLLQNDNAGPLEDFQQLAVSAVGDAVGGTVALDGGSVVFTPAPHFNGEASFAYTIVDDGADNGTPAPRTAVATARFTIDAVNDAPIANGDIHVVGEDDTLAVTCEPVQAGREPAGCVLANDTDIDGDTLTAELVSPPSHGTLALAADGSFTYTPAADYHGTDAFTYRALDGSTTSAAALVSLIVTAVDDVPVANDDGPFTTAEDAPLADIAVLANDTFGNAPLVGDGAASLVVAGGGATTAGGTATVDDAGTPGDVTDDRIDYTPPADHAGADSFGYTICDSDEQCDTAVVTLDVTPVNDAPAFTLGDDITTTEDAGAQMHAGFYGNASPGPANEAGQALSLAVTNDNAALFASAPAIDAETGALAFTGADDASGSAAVTVTLVDDGGNAGGGIDRTTHTFVVTITAANDAPVAQPDAFSIDEDGTLAPGAPGAPGVLGNDGDIDGDALVAQLVDAPTHGTLTLAPDGAFTYTPSANYHGSDAFTYRASDGNTTSAPATVTLTIASVNDAPVAGDDAYGIGEDGELVVTCEALRGAPTACLTANDSDVDGDALTTQLVSGPAHGTLTLGNDGGFTYAPAEDFNGSDAFTYAAHDGTTASPPATVTITVTGDNDAPVASADAYAAVEDDTLEIAAATGVLANDDDVDGDALTATLVDGPSHGTLVLAADGGFSYTPAADFNGSDAFTYTAGDGTASAAPATVTITIAARNDAPTFTLGGDQAVVEDAPAQTVASFLTAASAGPADEASQALSIAVANDQPALFAAAPAISLETGTLTYTPAPDASGSAIVTVTVTDDGGSANGGIDHASATFVIAVGAANDAPTAQDDAYAVDEDGTLDPAAPGVLGNDGDIDGDALSATLVDGPAHGTLTLAPNGAFTYTPTGDYHGADQFTYRAGDGTDTSGIATVALTVQSVNDAPVALADDYAATEDTPLVVTCSEVLAPKAPSTCVLANDGDVDGDTLTAQLVGAPAHGTVTLAADGGFTYTPAADFHGTDAFTYQASDGDATSAVTTATITVAADNDAPVAADDAYAVREDAVLTVPCAVHGGGDACLFANDGDVDGDAFTAEVVAGPSHGTLSLAPDGQFTYTPAADFNGADAFTYRVFDGAAYSNDATVALTVTPVNDAPSFAALVDQSVDEDAGTQSVAGFLADASAGPADEEGQALTVSVSTDNAALFETAPTITLPAGTLGYRPAADASGIATVTVTLQDDGGTADGGIASATRTFTITVGATNDAPVADDDAYSIAEDGVLTVDAATGVLAGDADIDGDAITATLVAGPAHGTLALAADGGFTYTPAADFNGSDAFTYTAGDGDAASAPATVTLTVTAVNDAPSFAALADQGVDEDAGAQTVAAFLTGASAGPADEASQSLSLEVTTDQPALFAAAPAIALGTGTLTYTGAADAHGVANVTVTLRDDAGGDDAFTRTFRITLASVNDAPAFTQVPADLAAVLEDATTGPLAITVDDVDGDTVTLLRSSGNQALFPNANVALGGSGNARTITFTTATDQNSAIVDPDFTEINLTALDAHGATTTVTFKVQQVSPVNDAPQFTLPTPAVTAAEDAGPRAVDHFATNRVVAPATGADELATQTLVALEVTRTAGTLAFTSEPAIDVATGRLTYETAPNAAGIATFQAVLVDSGSGTAPHVNRSVPLVFTIAATNTNDAPVAHDDAYATDEDAPLVIAANTGVIGNDVDLDGDALTAHVVTPPAHGTLSLGTDGAFTYTPAANHSGTDAFTYRVGDGELMSGDATVTFTITAVNDAPQGTADAFSTGEDEVLHVDAPGVLGNDADDEGDTLTAELATAPSHGTLTLAADGGFDYTPATDYTGTDAFTYRAHDGAHASAPVTVTLTVGAANDAPVATAQAVTTTEDAPRAITLAGTDPEGDALTYAIVDSPAHGTLAGDGAAWTYTPAADFNGSDAFTFTASDGDGTSAPATVSVTVLPVNDAPSFTASGTQAWPTGTSGTRTTPGWVVARQFGPADEAGQLVSAYVVTLVSDSTGVLAGPVQVGIDGTLQYALSGASGVAAVDVRLRDDGGTANGGVDLSAPVRLTIAVGLTADLSITKSNGLASVAENQVVTYQIVVRNTGGNVVNGARVTDPLPADLVSATWTCTGTGGGTCPASGNGDIDAMVDLPGNAGVTFVLVATVRGAYDDNVSNTAYVTPPATMVDGNGADNEATDTDAVSLFGDGME